MKSSVKSRGLTFLAIFAFVISVYAVALASDGDNNSVKKEVLTTLEQRMQKTISVDFRNTPIEDVIRIMSEQADVDIVKSPKVTGNVTATLKNVPLEEALHNILAAQGYTYVTSKNMIRVLPEADVTETSEALVNKIYRITYANVTEVEKALAKFISKRGSLSSSPATSNIIVTDTESKMKAVDTFIEEIDRITPQVLVEARIYDITSKDKLDLGIAWEAGNTTIASLGSIPTAGQRDPFIKGDFSTTAKKTESTTGSLRLGWLNNAIDIDTLLSARQENVNAKLLANPRVLVLDNEKAELKIVTQIPYQQLNQGQGGTGNSFGTTEFKEVGITLEVTPHVTREGMVRLKLKPKFGVQTGTVNVGDPTSTSATYPQPVVDERSADTTLLIKSNQTVVLGGLRRKETTQQVSKIPLLGDIPLVGALFRFTSEDTTNSEIVVFITPRIIEQPGMNATEQKQFEVTEFSTPNPVYTGAEKPGTEKANK